MVRSSVRRAHLRELPTHDQKPAEESTTLGPSLKDYMNRDIREEDFLYLPGLEEEPDPFTDSPKVEAKVETKEETNGNHKVVLTERLSKYLGDLSVVDPGDMNQHVRKTPRARMRWYDGMSAFLFTPGDPSVLWFSHEDKKMHHGVKSSTTYVSYLQVIATHDKEKEVWGKDYEHEDSTEEAFSTSRKRFGSSLPCTPRRRGDSLCEIPRNQSANRLPSLISSMEEEIKDEAIEDLPNIHVSWYGITNGKAVTLCVFDRASSRMTIDVAAYTKKKCNLGMHSKVPVHLPSFYFAQEGGFRVMHPSQAGRQCSVFMESPLSAKEWKYEFDRHDEVYVQNERMYCIDEAYIDMDNPLNPLEDVVVD
jgi:hypothetical protein